MPNYEANLSSIFKSLTDPSRRAMLARLSLGDATLGQLAEPLDMSLPAVHQHLAVLEEAGLVACEKRGRERWCRLEPDVLDEAARWILERRALWQKRLGALDRLLAAERTGKETRASKRKRRRPK
jgi:DNA-binding transcriptional ArsR family regulator